MDIPGELNFYGRQLIRGLKMLREQVNLSQQQAGDQLRMSLQKWVQSK